MIGVTVFRESTLQCATAVAGSSLVLSHLDSQEIHQLTSLLFAKALHTLRGSHGERMACADGVSMRCRCRCGSAMRLYSDFRKFCVGQGRVCGGSLVSGFRRRWSFATRNRIQLRQPTQSLSNALCVWIQWIWSAWH